MKKLYKIYNEKTYAIHDIVWAESEKQALEVLPLKDTKNWFALEVKDMTEKDAPIEKQTGGK